MPHGTNNCDVDTQNKHEKLIFYAMKLKVFEVLISNAKETLVNLVLCIKINKKLKLCTAF